MKKTSLCLTALALAGCAGTLKYDPPIGVAPITSTKELGRSRDEVWASMVPALGKQFFVINNLDKSSGLVNVSYSGDPERYVNCGWITSSVKNARGERSYSFPGARGHQRYEAFTPNLQLFAIDRKMDLDGRVNIILESVGPTQTRASVNTRYVMKLETTVRDMEGRSSHSSKNISFNGGAVGRFPATADGRATECQATGALEKELLDLIR
jgi:hypothetical protein